MSTLPDPASIELIEEILTPAVAGEKEFLWQDIMAAMSDILQTHTEETEALLRRILDFEGTIRLSPRSDIPGAMEPENMLRSLSVQALSLWRGQTYLKVFRRLHAATPSPALAGIVKVYIDKLEEGRGESPGIPRTPY